MLETVVVAIVLGIAAQIVADRMHLPAILPLLLFGMVAGPWGLGWIRPETLGHGLEVLVHLGVAIILFEGGLSLNLDHLRRVGGAVRNLLTVGAAITTMGAAGLAWWVVGLPWPTALLFGAIVMVTGPTVIQPLLRHMVAPRRVKVVLTSEGLIIDAIGATAAYLVLQWVERTEMPASELGGEILRLLVVGTILGFAAGSLARLVARRRFFGVELKNLTVLSVLMLCYLVAEVGAPQSGILASVVMGITMGAWPVPDLTRIKLFKGQITVFVISFVFVLLAAGLDLAAMWNLGWRGAAVTAGLILVVRPVSVLLSVMPSQMPLRDRIALSLTAPRGIVAAAVASLAALSLREAGIPGDVTLEGLVYLVILVTGIWATVMAVVLPRLLGYEDDPSRRRTVIVGASPFSKAVAGIVSDTGREVVVIDSVQGRLDPFLEAGHLTVLGDAREVTIYEEAGVARDTSVLALTTNDELNLLVAELVRDEFGVEHPVVVLQEPPEGFGLHSRVWVTLLGRREMEVPHWNTCLERGEARVVDVELEDEEVVSRVRKTELRHPDGIFPLCGLDDGEPVFELERTEWSDLESLLLLVREGEALAALESAVQPVTEQHDAVEVHLRPD